MNNEYLYGSFLPYFEALQLDRWLNRLCDLSRRLQNSGPIPEQITDAAAHNARSFNPQLRPAGTSVPEFHKLREREEKLKSMSPEEREAFLHSEWEEVEEKIRSGEIDLWDDTPTFVDRDEAQRFLTESLEYLRSKMCPAANRSTSFLEAVLLDTTSKLLEPPTPDTQKEVRGYQCLLTLWDTARMAHEGRPPYQIKFSEQVAEALGIDPVVEESRLATDYSLPDRFVRHALCASRLALEYVPKYNKEVTSLVAKLRQTKTRQ